MTAANIERIHKFDSKTGWPDFGFFGIFGKYGKILHVKFVKNRSHVKF